tara:strand:+ start:493 stop:732 length:240 start_codon:yes stop_codon:yes gene_type:complete
MKSLKRKYTGYYELKEGNLLVSIVKTSSNEWESSVQAFTHTAKDIFGKNVDMYEVIGENQFSDTKKGAYINLEQQIRNI